MAPNFNHTMRVSSTKDFHATLLLNAFIGGLSELHNSLQNASKNGWIETLSLIHPRICACCGEGLSYAMYCQYSKWLCQPKSDLGHRTTTQTYHQLTRPSTFSVICHGHRLLLHWPWRGFCNNQPRSLEFQFHYLVTPEVEGQKTQIFPKATSFPWKKAAKNTLKHLFAQNPGPLWLPLWRSAQR